ncbi:LuxR C-terminal-related transcriptional regulator [Rhodococcus sp. NPDC127528]|uniref:helix-turn-helix transcriptional regulator n=1 Tax=unclassified Rhodococcus (in: high G+C Gram-positive bacteria) TaxID=192944 RepID=UPI003645E22C
MSTASILPLRTRLLRRLDENAALTVVWGPAGYGKSTLVESWLGKLTGVSVSRVAEPADATAPEWYWDEVRRAVATITNHPAVLVVERPDKVTDPNGWDLLREICGDHPDLRTVVTVRDAGFFWGRGIPGRDLTIVGPAELEFTADEVVELCTAHGLGLSERTVRQRPDLVAGHPALTELALNVARVFGHQINAERSHAIALLCSGNDRYVQSELLGSGLAPHLRELAVTLASVGTLSVGAVAALGVDDAEGALAALERGGLIFRLPGASGLRWRYPAAVRASLLRLAEQEGARPPDEAAAGLARWLADNGEPVEAIRHATEAGEWRLVVDLILDRWVEIGMSETHVLIQALTAIPDAIVRSSSTLYYARELAARVASDRPRRLIPMLTESRDLEAVAVQYSPENAVLTGTLRSVVFRWRGDHEEAVRHHELLAELSVGLLADRTDEALRSARLPLLWLHLGQSSQFHDDHTPAAQFFRLAFDGSGDRWDDFVGRQAAGHLALLYALRGDVGAAEKWIERESAYGETPGWVGTAVGIPAAVARGLVALDRMDVDGAASAIDALPELQHTVEYWPFVEYTRSQLDLACGRPEVALDRLDRTTSRFRRWITPGSLARPLLASMTMDLRTAMGEGAAVLTHVDRGGDRMHVLVRLATARAALLSGNAAAALAHTGQLTGRDIGHTRVRLEALLIEAMARIEIGDHDGIHRAWNRAVALTVDTGLLRPLSTVPAETITVLSEMGTPPPADWRELDSAGFRSPYPAPPVVVDLTGREAAVLAGLSRGDSVAGIAEGLYVSPNTVKTQLRSLYRKLGVHSRAEALDEARRLGLL